MENNLTTSLLGLNALVCGSTSGIGRSTAIEFSKSGANVTLFSRNEEKLHHVKSLLFNNGNQKHQYLVGDFNNPESIKKILESQVTKINYHILINNSGGPKGGGLIDAKLSEFLETFNRHLLCNHIIVQQLFSGMKVNEYGRIINIISTSVKEPISGLGVSNTIRGAVASWAKTLSVEIAKHNITVNNILPGFTQTSRLSSLIKSKAKLLSVSEESVSDNMKKQVPLIRFGKPEETAKAIKFLASPASGYINGVSLAIDGGRIKSI